MGNFFDSSGSRHGSKKNPISVTTMWLSMFFLLRGYYTVTQRYEFYFQVAEQYFYKRAQGVSKILFCHSKTKFVASSYM